MTRIRQLKAWVPVLACMAVIFAGSTDALSVQHTSRIIGPLLRWLIPGISDASVGWVQLFVRKTGHATEYALLAGLLWRALNQKALGRSRPWPARWAWWSWVLATAYATTDEFHQSFVGSRQGQVHDVLIDAVGAAAGVTLIWWFGRLRGRWTGEGEGGSRGPRAKGKSQNVERRLETAGPDSPRQMLR